MGFPREWGELPRLHRVATTYPTMHAHILGFLLLAYLCVLVQSDAGLKMVGDAQQAEPDHGVLFNLTRECGNWADVP
jgi:hypothetical protein